MICFENHHVTTLYKLSANTPHSNTKRVHPCKIGGGGYQTEISLDVQGLIHGTNTPKHKNTVTLPLAAWSHKASGLLTGGPAKEREKDSISHTV